MVLSCPFWFDVDRIQAPNFEKHDERRALYCFEIGVICRPHCKKKRLVNTESTSIFLGRRQAASGAHAATDSATRPPIDASRAQKDGEFGAFKKATQGFQFADFSTVSWVRLIRRTNKTFRRDLPESGAILVSGSTCHATRPLCFCIMRLNIMPCLPGLLLNKVAELLV